MKRQLIGLAAIAALVLAGCSQDTGQSATPAGPAAPTTAAATSSSTSNDSATVNYHPVIVPADFSTRITNPYFPLTPGTAYVFDGVRDGAPQHTEVTVTNETNPLAPDRIDKKWYGPGVGLVKVIRDRTGHHEEAELVKIKA